MIGLNDRGRRMIDDIRGVFGTPGDRFALAAAARSDALVGATADGAALRTAIDVLVRCEALAIREPAAARALDIERERR